MRKNYVLALIHFISKQHLRHIIVNFDEERKKRHTFLIGENVVGKVIHCQKLCEVL